MASEWSTLSLREAHVTLIDCDHRTPPASAEGFPYVAIPQLSNGHIDLSAARRISPDHFADWTRKARPTANDVVLSRRCNPGETAFVPSGLEFALGQNLVLLRADGEKVYPPFLRWLVRGPEWWAQISKFLNAGAVFDSLKCADVPNFELPVPPLPTQRAIAAVLGALDDKIELNRRMNETLEGMARALFKSWFVDFDPVRAKSEGRQPWGMDAETAALFPNEFQESELGPIPQGWRVAAIADVADVNSRSVSGAAVFDEIEYVDIASVTEGKLEGSTRVRWDEAPSRARRLVSDGDTIWSTVRPNRRSYLFISDPPNNMVVSTGFCVLSPEKVGAVFLHEWVTRPEFVDYLVANADGSAYPAVRADRFAEAPILNAGRSIVLAFEHLARPLFRKSAANARESTTLAELRDTLLPKLLSGEVRVRDAARLVEAAG